MKRGKVRHSPPLVFFLLMLVNCMSMKTNIELVSRCEKTVFKVFIYLTHIQHLQDTTKPFKLMG